MLWDAAFDSINIIAGDYYSNILYKFLSKDNNQSFGIGGANYSISDKENDISFNDGDPIGVSCLCIFCSLFCVLHFLNSQ